MKKLQPRRLPATTSRPDEESAGRRRCTHALFKSWPQRTRSVAFAKLEVIGPIITRKVRVTSLQRPLADLITLFGSTTGHHPVPMIAEGGKLVGIITQSDLVAAFGRAAHLAI